MNMKNVLLASVALVFVAATAGFAATPNEFQIFPTATSDHNDLQMLADNDGGSGGGKDDGADHDSNDDNGSSASNDDSADDNDDDDGGAANNVKKPESLKGQKVRVPGGKGCDSARDKAEHPECTAN
jgi:hypothetical protein